MNLSRETREVLGQELSDRMNRLSLQTELRRIEERRIEIEKMLKEK